MTQRMQLIAGILILFITFAACTLGSAATSITPASAASPMSELSTAIPPTPLPASPEPMAESPTPTLTPTATLTPTVTASPTAGPPRPTPTSSGPLDFTARVVGCRNDPSRQGGVILTIQIDAVGGNGVYTYVREEQTVERISDRPATRGSGVIDAFIIQSGDGQRVERKVRLDQSEWGCP